VSMSCLPEGCHPALDTGSSGVCLIWRMRLLEDGCRGLPGGNSLSFASPKESKQRKGDPLLRPFGVPKISRQQRAARKLAARGGFIAKGNVWRSPLKQCERTAPVAGAKFWRSNMGNSRARIFAMASCANPHITIVIPGFKHAGAGSERSRRICFSLRESHYQFAAKTWAPDFRCATSGEGNSAPHERCKLNYPRASSGKNT
jgi:hypothetical protein